MSPSTLILLVVFCASGFAGLVYEVLWMQRLGLVFGHTASAAAMTLAVFFAGISAGSLIWGERAARVDQPLRLYALLEVGIALAAAASLCLFSLYDRLFPALFAHFHATRALFFASQCGLAFAAVFPPALCMGGTLPAMGQHLVRHRGELGRTASLLYAINTVGGAVGAFVAGFYLPPLLGFSNVYTSTIALSIVLGGAAYALSRFAPVSVTNGELHNDRATGRAAVWSQRAGAVGEDGIGPAAILALAAVSGFVALGLEVLWTRMFAQVLHNSVYSFAVILVSFLLTLALGAALAHALARRQVAPVPTLCGLLLAAGVAIGTSPYVFWWMTDGLSYVAPQQAWSAYIWRVFGTAAMVLLVPGVLLGTVFPYLHRLAQRMDGEAGAVVGRLAAANTLAGIAGSLAAGFALLSWLGLWASVRTLALFYLVAAVLVAQRAGPARAGVRAAAVAAAFLLLSVADPARLSIVRRDPKGREQVYETWESRDAVVSVVRVGKNLRIRVDNYYSLGGTAARRYEETQADIPLLIHPRPRTVFFLGLGTGITAGAALRHPAVERVIAVELIPAVVDAARKYFGQYTNGLFHDARARVVTADGRSYLLGTPERYDVIVSDLFIPWQAGAGSLYTREHFAIAARRLAPGGVFAQWLPLYQLSREETFTIIHTMLEVFPQVTMWRGDFLPDRPIIALIGEMAERPLDVAAVVDNFRRRRQRDVPTDHVVGLMGLFYLGNLGANRDLFQPYPVNTDDRPLIEYSSPITQRHERAHAGAWFTSLDLATWQTELVARTPPAEDPYLRTLGAREQDFMRAGLYLFQARVYGKAGRVVEATAAAEQFRALVPVEISQMFERQPEQWNRTGKRGSN